MISSLISSLITLTSSSELSFSVLIVPLSSDIKISNSASLIFLRSSTSFVKTSNASLIGSIGRTDIYLPWNGYGIDKYKDDPGM